MFLEKGDILNAMWLKSAYKHINVDLKDNLIGWTKICPTFNE